MIRREKIEELLKLPADERRRLLQLLKRACMKQPKTYDDSVSIEVPNVYAWVCPVDGEASFTSDTTDELIETVRDLVTPAKRARERRSMPTEYIVRVA